MEMIRVEVVAPMGRKRKFQVLWLVYAGQTMPDLATIWRIYLRRFALEHWYRLAKQRLHWTQPQLHSVQATERWSLLILLVTWQLWLARRECIDTPLPWQAAQDNLAPGRVAQAFASILLAIGTPAHPPKPRGKSPGRTTGECPPRRLRYPMVKKRAPRPKTSKTIRTLAATMTV
jgi:hypothetical protein